MPSLQNFTRSRSGSHFLDTVALSSREILSILKRAHEFEQRWRSQGTFLAADETARLHSKVVSCLFFEPSTRTRMSFQTAAYRLGHQVSAMELSSGSSLSKGETYGDTVLNIAAMEPDAIIVRYGHSPELDEVLPQLPMPVINAGSGTRAHPSQALLDAYTLLYDGVGHRVDALEGENVLIVGDIAHSRVARSNFDVLAKLGADIAVCGPSHFIPKDLPAETKVFSDLDEAIEWATVYMGLRIQLERHASAELNREAMDEYHRHFGLNHDRLKILAKDAMILHPGPINYGVEFSAEVIQDSRSRVLRQVGNGVFVRAALLERVLSENGKRQ
jgi:aspartate carbamoyltransferase catalytic subunit